MKDEPIEEIREIRHQLSEACGHDVHRYGEYLRSLESEYRRQLERYEAPETWGERGELGKAPAA